MHRRLGRYLINDPAKDELGRGSFGRVYRAWDPNVNRYVAIKVLTAKPDPDLLLRFRDECKTTGKLEHPNIVQIYDFESQDEMPYLVMELVEGDTLEAIIRTGMISGRPVQLLDKVEMMFQVAKALQHAHRGKVIHRDVKPGNIMVRSDGVVKVTDFGIARALDRAGTRPTRQGDIAGTLVYMAPEQFKGHDADPRTDIFAYGDVYYELLTGQQPFLAEAAGTVMYRITSFEPVPVGRIVPECPAALENLIQRLMAKEREIRPETLDDVITDTEPIRQQLRQQRAVAIAVGIQPLVDADAVDQAQALIQQVVQLDPMNPVARHWREQLQKQKDRKTHLRRGTECMAARRFQEARQCFAYVAKLDQTDDNVLSLMQTLDALVRNVESAAGLISEAREMIAQGQLEGALDRLNLAASLDPGNPEAVPLRDEIRRLLEATLLTRVEGCRSRGDYTAALASLGTLEALSPGNPLAAELRARVEGEQAEAERRRRHEQFLAGVDQARQWLYSQQTKEAAELADRLLAEYPDEPAAADLVSEVGEFLAAQRRQEAIAGITQIALTLIREQRLGEAQTHLQLGLASYPGEAGLSRLLDIATALSAAQERVRRVNQVVDRSRELCENGRLDEGLQLVDTGIAEFGKEPALMECKRNLEYEREQREYLRGLQAKLDQAKSLLANSRPQEAADLLEDAAYRYPGEPEITLLLSSAQLAVVQMREREFVAATSAQIASMEAANQLEAAGLLAEAALERYPNSPQLIDTANQLRWKLRLLEHQQAFDAQIRRIEEFIRIGNWDQAVSGCAAGKRNFPDERIFDELSTAVETGRREAGIRELCTKVRARQARQDVRGMEQDLEATRAAWGAESAWQALYREFELYRTYQDALERADRERNGGRYSEAESILLGLLATAPDRRAAQLLAAVTQSRQAAEQEKARIEEENRRREEEEQARRRAQHDIEQGCAEAERLQRGGDSHGAIAILDRLLVRFPDQSPIRLQREAVLGELERRRREAEEKARQEAEIIAVANGIKAATGILNGNPRGAIQLLEDLRLKYPNRPEIVQARTRALEELERRRRAAEEEAKRRQEAEAIAAGRAEAAELSSRQDYHGALALLKRLAGKYPNESGIQQDRDAVERQRTAAEEEEKRRQEAEAIAAGRAEAAELCNRQDYNGALALLERLAGKYPHEPGIQQDRETVERKRREAEEEAKRRQEAEEIATGRAQAAELCSRQDYYGALALLERLAGKYPHEPGIQQDRETVERKRRAVEEAAEEAAKRRQQAEEIAARRAEAAELCSRQDYKGALATLELLARKYPHEPGIEHDREAVERQRTAAAIAAGRAEAAELCNRQDYNGALALLERLARKYPHEPGIQQDREVVESQAQIESVKKVRGEAAELRKHGDAKAALALLDEMARKYPDDAGVAEDRAAVRISIEEEARQRREQQAIAKACRDAARMTRQGDPQGALAILDRLAKEYPNHREIEAETELARKELLKQEIEIANVRAQAAGLVQKGVFQEAITLLSQLNMRFPQRSEIEQELAAVGRDLERQHQTAEEQARRKREDAEVAQGREQASRLVEARDLPGAIAVLDRLGKQFPDRREIGQDRTALEARLEQQRREAEEQARRQKEESEIARGRELASGFAQAGDFLSAIAMLDRLAKQFPNRPEIREDRAAAAHDLERQRREAEEQARWQRVESDIAGGRKKASELVKKGEFQAAIAVLDRLGKQYPDRPEIGEDQRVAEQAWERQRVESDIAGGRKKASELAKKGEFQAAIAVLDQLGKQYPDRPEIIKDRGAADQALERQRREAEEQARLERQAVEISAGREQAAGYVRVGDYASAIAVLDRLCTQFPDSAEIRQDRASAEREWKNRREAEKKARIQREEAEVASGRAEASALAGKGDFTGALSLLDRLQQQHPNHAGIRQDLDRTQRELKQQQQREAEIVTSRATAVSLLRSGDCAGAVALLNQLAARYPNHAGITADWAAAEEALNAVLRREAAERERQRQEEEERARRLHEEAIITNARRQAGTLLEQGDYLASLRILDDLVLQYPGRPEIAQHRQLVKDEAERIRLEAQERAKRTEERAKQALAAFSAKKQDKTWSGDESQKPPDWPEPAAETPPSPIVDLEERAKKALFANSQKRKTETLAVPPGPKYQEEATKETPKPPGAAPTSTSKSAETLTGLRKWISSVPDRLTSPPRSLSSKIRRKRK